MSNVILVPKDKKAAVLVPVQAVQADLVTKTEHVIYAPLADTFNYGMVKVGDGLNIVAGVISLNNNTVLDLIAKTPYVSYGEKQELTEEQMRTARDNIRAGDSGFSGYYKDLVNIPSLNTNNEESQLPQEDETILNEIKLHKIAKTGDYADLLNKLELANDDEANEGLITTKAINPVQLRTAIEGLGTVFDLKGSVETYNDLPQENNQIGDVWYVSEEAVGYVWLNDGVIDRWEKLGPPIDLSNYATIAQLNNKVDKVEYSKDQTFADGSDGGVIGRLYMRFRDNTENSIVANCQNVKYTVPVRDANGNFYVGNPTQLYHTVNLISVTALQGEGAPTESTTALFVGQLYNDTTNNNTYECVSIDKTNKVYTWVKLIRETDYASGSAISSANVKSGIVNIQPAGQGGVAIATTKNQIITVKATHEIIDARTPSNYLDGATVSNNHCRVISPAVLDYAVKKALADNKLVDTDDAWTDEEKANARALIEALGNTDYATDSVAGVARWVTGFGLSVDEYGRGKILQATKDEILAKTQEYKPITPKNLDYAVKVGMTTNAEEWSDEEKTNARDLLGFVDLANYQTITGIKTFTEQIGIANTDGTIDYLKHINNNFLISTSAGTNLLNIDEGLSKIYAFNKELAFKEDITGGGTGTANITFRRWS